MRPTAWPKKDRTAAEQKLARAIFNKKRRRGQIAPRTAGRMLHNAARKARKYGISATHD